MTCKIKTNVRFLKFSRSFHQLNNFMNKVQEIEWEKCCVCGSEEKDNQRSTTKGIEALAGQFVEFWKNGLLLFDPAKTTTSYNVEKDGTEHPDFERFMLKKSAKYHHSYHIRYSPYNLARQKKSLRSNNKKAEGEQSGAFLRLSTGPNSRGSSNSAIPGPICIVCGEHDTTENVHAAGAFHTSKSKLNAEQVMKLTKVGEI